MKVLADNWSAITDNAISEYDTAKSFGGFTHADILSETFEHVIRESKITTSTETEIINHFLFVHKKIMFKIIKNNQLAKKILYNANHIQTQTEE